MRRVSVLTLLVLAVLAVAATGVASAAGPSASAAATCSVKGKERKLGATYVTRVTARGISCSGALEVVKAFHACRRARGGADGRCRRFSGYRCRERRSTSPTQYDSRATCTKNGRRVVQQYTQNT